MSKRTKHAKKTAAPSGAPPPKFIEPETALVLRTIAADMVSRGTDNDGNPRPDFTWPALGPVECPDWTTEPKCGHGLHGQIWGEGDWSLLSKDPTAKWQVVEIQRADMVDLGHEHKGKVKFRCGNVLYTGESAIAVTMVLAGEEAFARDAAKAAASSGEGSKAASSGNYSTAASSGYGSTAASSGNYSTAASSGEGSTAASSGNGSKATQKDGAAGIAAAIGNYVVVQAGERGLLIATWWDASAKRYRAVVGEVGVDGIEAGVDYLVKGGKLTKV